MGKTKSEMLYILYKNGKDVRIKVAKGEVAKIIESRERAITTHVTWTGKDADDRPFQLQIGDEAIVVRAEPVDEHAENK